MLIILVSASFVTVLNQTLVAPALPTIMREFSIDATTGQWLTTGFMLVNAIMIPITAFIQEKFSIRNIFGFAMTIFAVGSALCGWGPAFLVLLAGRMIQAVGAGIMMPMCMAVMLTSFPLERRGSAMGIVGTVFACAPAIGPFASGVMVAYVGWHYMFWIIAALSILVCAVGFFMMQKEIPEGAGRVHLDVLSVVFSTFGLAFLLYGLSVFGSAGLSILDGSLIIAGIVLVVLFCVRQKKLEHPMLEIRVLKNRNFSVATVVGMVAQASIVSTGILMPIYVQTVLGYNSIVSGLVIFPGSILSAFVSPWAGKWYDKHGPRGIILTGLALLFCANLCFGFLKIDGSPIVVGLIFVVRQFGISLSNMTSTTWGMSNLDDSLAPHASSVQNTLRTVAASLGTAIVVSVSALVEANLSATMGPSEAMVAGINVAFWVLSGFILLSFILALIFVKKTRPEADKESATIVDEITAAENMQIVNSIMKADVYCLKADVSVREAMSMLIDNHISGAPVVDENMKPVGFFSDGDFLKRLARTTERFDDPLALMCAATIERVHVNDKIEYLMQLKVSDLCTNECLCVNTKTSIADICRVISDHHLKKIPVTENGKIVGIINRSDITKYSVEKFLSSTK